MAVRDVERAAFLARDYLADVLPAVVDAYRDAALQDAEDLAPRYGRA
jgi:hypothetical protein